MPKSCCGQCGKKRGGKPLSPAKDAVLSIHAALSFVRKSLLLKSQNVHFSGLKSQQKQGLGKGENQSEAGLGGLMFPWMPGAIKHCLWAIAGLCVGQKVRAHLWEDLGQV